MNEILETTRFVFDNAKSVKLDAERIAAFTRSFEDDNLPHWLSGSPISYAHLNDADKLSLLLVFNSTSFSYWGEPKWAVEYHSKRYNNS